MYCYESCGLLASETAFTGEKGAGYSFTNLSYWQFFANFVGL